MDQIQALTEQVEQLKIQNGFLLAKLQIARKVVDFYADWTNIGRWRQQKAGFNTEITSQDWEMSGGWRIGGKAAREGYRELKRLDQEQEGR